MQKFCRLLNSAFAFTPSARNQTKLRHLTPALSPVEAERENGRTTALSFALWLRNTSYWNSSGMALAREGNDARPRGNANPCPVGRRFSEARFNP